MATPRALLDQLRGGDTVARYGGEEFVVVLPGVNVAGAYVVGERILRALRAIPHEVCSAQLTVTAFLGLAVQGAGSAFARMPRSTQQNTRGAIDSFSPATLIPSLPEWSMVPSAQRANTLRIGNHGTFY